MSRRPGTAHGALRTRGRLAALGLLAAAAVAVAGIVAGGPSAQAAGPAVTAGSALRAAPTTVTEVTTAGRSLTVAVTPYSGLAPSGAQITVTGSGFDPSHDLWVAVCQDDRVAPAALVHCVGGAIPDDNTTAGWGVVTDAAHAPYAGPVTTRWGEDGSFRMTLQLPAAISESADCVSAPCSVYTRSSEDSDRSEDVGVPVTFTPPPGEAGSAQSSASSAVGSASAAGSVSTTTVAPTTQTFGAARTTVTPDSMLTTSVVAGGPQTVVFTGFSPGETVNVTLYSKPIKLPAVTASPNGTVRVSFTVPAHLPPGEHTVEAIGSRSGRVGLARFTVGAASSTTTAAASATASTVPSTAASAAASAPLTGVPASGATSQALPASSAVTAPSTVASSSRAAVAPAAGNGHRLLWLWIVLAILVIVGGAAGVVAMVRNRREGGDDDLPVPVAGVPPSPGWGPAGAAAPGATSVAAPDHDAGYGLLSGREHPDGPTLYSGEAWPAPTTRVIGGSPAAPQGPATQQWRPDFTGVGPDVTGRTPDAPEGGNPDAPEGGNPDAPAGGPGPSDAGGGPATQQWRPDFTGGTRPVPPGSVEPPPAGPGDEGGRHRSD